METIHGRATAQMDRPGLETLVAPYERVVLDIGTGDGKLVYRLARAQPRAFFIGVDASRDALRKVSSRIGRKPGRGGLANALFVAAGAEELPSELDGLVIEVYIIMPWGSLLEGLVLADERILGNISRACVPGARAHILLNNSIFGDPVPREVAHLPPLTLDYVDERLTPAYARAGLSIIEREMVAGGAMARVPASWARRLASAPRPQSLRIEVEPLGHPSP